MGVCQIGLLTLFNVLVKISVGVTLCWPCPCWPSPNQQMPKLRHANTMPTHANKMDKTGGTPLCCAW